MKIIELSLKNYRGAESLHLELDPNLNVFIGVNGSGKSTVLDAIAIMLSWVVSRIRSAGASGRPIMEADITNGKSAALITLTCIDDNQHIPWRLTKVRKGNRLPEFHSDLSKLNDYTKQTQTKITDSHETINLPVLIYYPVNRAVLDIPLKIRSKHSFSLLDSYNESLISGASFRLFFEWFREQEDLENEQFHEENKWKSSGEVLTPIRLTPNHQINSVRKALKLILPEFTDFSIRRSPLRMEVKKNDKVMIINQLSDGEKCLIAMVGDLARRIAIANPTRENPLEGEGIVLIDEIDLHLHPKWQRNVIPKLTEVFPNCQFIISTHSPHVINQVQPDNIFLLDQTPTGIVATHPSKSYGNNADRILEDLMGLETTRPDNVFQDLRDIYELIGQDALPEATNKIAILKEKIGPDPELVKAEVLIRRKEIIGK
jgi:predicted ATP-binding protein involved in virulence